MFNMKNLVLGQAGFGQNKCSVVLEECSPYFVLP